MKEIKRKIALFSIILLTGIVTIPLIGFADNVEKVDKIKMIEKLSQSDAVNQSPYLE